jgi:hypothetical protein
MLNESTDDWNSGVLEYWNGIMEYWNNGALDWNIEIFMSLFFLRTQIEFSLRSFRILCVLCEKLF